MHGGRVNQPLPKYINTLSICKALGPEWRPERVRRILRNMGIARRMGMYWYVSPEDLAGAWPECYEEILAKIAELKPYLRQPTKKRSKPANRQTEVRSECDHKWSVVGGLPMTQTQCVKCGRLF